MSLNAGFVEEHLCLLLLVFQSTTSLIEAIVERKTAAKVLMLWKYQHPNQELKEGDDPL